MDESLKYDLQWCVGCVCVCVGLYIMVFNILTPPFKVYFNVKYNFSVALTYAKLEYCIMVENLK